MTSIKVIGRLHCNISAPKPAGCYSTCVASLPRNRLRWTRSGPLLRHPEHAAQSRRLQGPGRACRSDPSNQAPTRARRRRQSAQDSLVFSSPAELAPTKPLGTLSGNPSPRTRSPSCRCRELSSVTRASAPRTSSWLATAAPRHRGRRTRHYAKTRKADDQDRDRHWYKCGVHTIRIPASTPATPHRSKTDCEDLRAKTLEGLTAHSGWNPWR